MGHVSTCRSAEDVDEARRRRTPAAATPTLPPPAWTRERCGIGFDGEVGCRVCVEACPYGALRPLATAGELRLHVDPGLCRRCGACTSACPTSALERAFLPDAEIDARVVGAVEGSDGSPVVLLLHASSQPLAGRLAPELAVVPIELRSLLVLDETHLLHALRCGARAVVVLGHADGHHGAPHLLETPLRIARAALRPGDADRLLYVEDLGESAADETLARLAAFAARTGTPAHRADPSLIPAGSHRQRFAALAVTGVEPASAGAALESVPFGEVAVHDPNCTLCGACSRVCPTQALDFQGARGRLDFRGIDCIGCGLCEQACPERAVTLTPGLRLRPALFERQTLVEDEGVPCRQCGAPHVPRRLLAHSRRLLSQVDGPLASSTRQIDLCPDCRSVAVETPRAGRGTDLSRRGFLGSASTALGGLVALASGRAKAADAAPEGAPGTTRRLGMVIDLQRCIGCHACTAACKAENQVPLGVYRDWVEEHVLGDYPHARPYFLPKLCNHCDDPACLRSCPTGALHMRPDGIVDMNHDICIGCRACNQACPYGVPFMDPVRGTSDKCNFCAHRVDEGLNPACVDICPTGCRIFGDLNDPDSKPSRALRDQPHQVLRQELGLGPNVRYLGLPAELDR